MTAMMPRTHRCPPGVAATLLIVVLCIPPIQTSSASLQPRPAGTPTPATVDEVFRTLDVDTVPTDTVLLIDTSGSMQRAGLYDHVRGALRPLLGALSSADHLAVLSFDAAPALRFTGDVRQPAARILARLPRRADGQFTDIGAAIDSGLRELERPHASPVGAIVLITDGRAQPPAGSSYTELDGDAWSALRQRASALSRRHRIDAYALALRADTDAALIKRVFADAIVLALPTGQLRPFIQRIRERLRLETARSLLADDVGAAVEVRWSHRRLEQLDLARGSGDLELELSSTAHRLPLELSRITVHSTGELQLQVSGLPSGILLRPGERRTLTAHLRFPPAGGFGFGTRTVRRHSSVMLSATVSTPWDDALRNELRLDLRPWLRSEPAQASASGVVGWSYPLLALAALALFALIASACFVVIARRPSLRGTLIASPPGRPQQRARLAGRRFPVGQRRGSRLAIPGDGVVRGRRIGDRHGRRRRCGVELLISYSAGTGRRRRATCPPNASAVVDGTTFVYHAR